VPTKRIHGGDPREKLDKLVLFLAFVVGASGTVLLKIVEADVLLIAAFPVVVLLAYVAACLALRSLGTEPETIGDNSYYLGFLFTLASLSVTLYKIRDISTNEIDLIPLVISGFGVALTSTIAGVFLRVFLLQLRPDIVARDREARRDLAAGARDLREAMAHASRQLKSISVETQQHVAERNSRMSEVLEIQVEKTSELMERQSKAYEQLIQDFGRRLTEDITKMLQQEFGTLSHELGQATKSFREGLDALSQSRASAESGLVSSLGTFKEVIDELRAKSAERDKTLDASYKTIAARSQKVAASLSEASDTVQTAVSMSRLVVEEAQRAAGESRANIREEEAQFRRHAEAVVKAMGELEEVIRRQVEGISRQTLPLASTPITEPPPAPSSPGGTPPGVAPAIALSPHGGHDAGSRPADPPETGTQEVRNEIVPAQSAAPANDPDPHPQIVAAPQRRINWPWNN
jgi:hypothetical protein